MANAIISFGNVIDAAVLSGGNWLAALPLTNLQNRTLGKVARSADATTASSILLVDTGGNAGPFQTVAIANHNLSLAAKYRVRASDDTQLSGFIRNPNGNAAAIPGPLPTYWNYLVDGGLSWAIAAINVINGVTYLDFVLQGVPTANGYPSVFFEQAGQIAAVPSQTWINKINVQLVGGSLANTNLLQVIDEGSGGAYNGGSGNAAIVPTAIAQDFVYQRKLVTAGTTWVNARLSAVVTAGQAVNLTVRIALPALSRLPYYQTDWIYDPGLLDVWPAIYQTSNMSWQDSNFWFGRYTETQRQGYTWTTVFNTPYPLNSRYWEITLFDTTNPAGYIQFGRLFLGNSWQTQVNMSIGAGIGWNTDTAIQQAVSGAEYFANRTPYRVAQFTTGFMSVDEGFGNAFEIQRRMGVDKEVVFQFDPADTIHALRRQYLGRLRQLSPVEYPYPTITSTAWEIKELL